MVISDIQKYLKRVQKMQYKADHAKGQDQARLIARYSTIIRNYNWDRNGWKGIDRNVIDKFIDKYFISGNLNTLFDIFAYGVPNVACKMYHKLLGKQVTESDFYINDKVIHQANLYMVYGMDPKDKPRLLTTKDFDPMMADAIKILQNPKPAKPKKKSGN